MRFTFVILLFCCLGADAQMIIKAHPNYVPFASANLLLDQYSGAAGAYSLRKLRTAYTANAIRVRRSNDNTEQDIGFTSAGDLDTASLKTFVGANSGFVTTWYNQGDSASLDLTQATAANQPRIVNAGTIERRNTKPSIFFDGSNDRLAQSGLNARIIMQFLNAPNKAAIFAVNQSGITSNPNNLQVLIDNTNISTNDIGYSLFFDDRSASSRNNNIWSFVTRNVINTNVSSNISNNDSYTPNQLNLISNLLDNSNVTASERNKIYINNGAEIALSTNTSTAVNGYGTENLAIGTRAKATSNFMTGYFSEILFYNSDQSSNRTAIQNNINSYYAIY
jgi:hypothetical protein